MRVSTAEAVRALSERLTHRSSQDVAAEAAAKALLPLIVQTLREQGATRVVMFGSLATGMFREGSDIDLAIAGLSEPALARLERELTLFAGRAVELANLDSVPTVLRERIERVGQDLR